MKAIVDLGTNTFNFLIFQKDKEINKIIYSTKRGVKLGENGITKGIISDEAMKRAIDALKYYKSKIEEYEIKEVFAFATAAVRSAKNQKEFIESVKKETGIDIKVISGEKEAELIYLGVKQAVSMTEEVSLILDIGGGSNELVFANNSKIFWAHSFSLGATRLLEQFKPENPISKETIIKIENFLQEELQEFWKAAKEYPVEKLIGSSGSFDTFRSLIRKGEFGEELSYSINANDFLAMHKQLISKNVAERSLMPGMDAFRVELIVLGSIFTNFIVNKLNIKEIIQSNYALREGAMSSIQ